MRILILFFTFFMVTSAVAEIHKNNKKYNYIEIAECFIPIPKESELIRQESMFEYSFYRPFESMLTGMQINKKEKNDYQKQLERITKIPSMVLVSEEKRGNFSVIVSEWKTSNFTDKIYYMVGNKTTIIFNEFDKKESYYLIDYCESTWKKDTLHNEGYNYISFDKYEIPVLKDLKQISHNYFKADKKKVFGIKSMQIELNISSTDILKRKIYKSVKNFQIFDLVSETQNHNFKVVVYELNQFRSKAMRSLVYFLINDKLSIVVTATFSKYAKEPNDDINDEINYIVKYLSDNLKN